MRRIASLVLALAIVVSTTVSGQAPRQAAAKPVVTKRPLTHNDYDGWRAIQGTRLSRNGAYLAYLLVPQDGDGELVVRQTGSTREWRHGIGARPTPSTAIDEETGAAVGAAPLPSPSFSADMRFVVFVIQPTKAEAEQARKAKKKPDDQPKNAIGIMSLADGKVTRIERVKSFQAPDSGAAVLAYLMEPRPAEKKAAGDSTSRDSTAKAPASRGKVDYGTDLVLRSFADQGERTFADVLEYTLSRDGNTLVYAVSSRTPEKNGVYAISGAGAPAALLAGKGKYRRITWDDYQARLAFLADQADSSDSRPDWKLYHWDRRGAQAEELVTAATPNFRPDMVISERGSLDFSDDGGKVYFGMASPPPPEKDTSVVEDEKVVMDLWHWKDDFIQPMQKVRAPQERNRSYRVVYHRAEKKLVPLADETMPSLNPTVDGRWALGQDDRPYRMLVGVDASYADVFVVNTNDGSRTRVLEKHRGNVSLSPVGKYGLFYRDRNWFILSIPEGKVTNLTQNLGTSFWREDYDSPSPAPDWGYAGWTRDEKYVLLNDRYDIWQVATDGSGAKNLTDGVGRKEKTIFRYLRIDPDEPGPDRGIDGARPLLLSAVNEWTRDQGFYRDRIDGGLPEKLVMGKKSYGNVTRAKNADVVVLTVQSFNEFPDLWVTSSDFKTMSRVSDANPQKKDLVWGTSELVRYRNTDGVPLSGILMKPENFDPTKKYPMVVYIYEKLSQNLNRFVNPSPGTSINPAYYVSNGYLVYEPDIVYTIGYPGQSALKSVLPAIQAVVDQGFVDDSAIGIQGHSWGGYQIAYMVTQTNRFKAAAPGAVVANMTSAYSGIRWGSGLPRQFQYEHTQSRIGGTIWEYPMRFMENSPLFQLDRVQTPLMTIHNDADDAVPWYQGIELYLGLRRLGKEAYLFNYNGEPHGLRKRVNQKDYTRRLQQFFDHYLKGAPAPDWMEKGVPFLERDKPKVTSE